MFFFLLLFRFFRFLDSVFCCTAAALRFFFLLPMAIAIMWMSWPVFVDAWVRNEISTNAGGLIVWPARLMLPIGFFLLILQGFSELIKRVAFLRGLIPDPTEKHEGPSLEEQLAEALRKERGEAA